MATRGTSFAADGDFSKISTSRGTETRLGKRGVTNFRGHAEPDQLVYFDLKAGGRNSSIFPVLLCDWAQDRDVQPLNVSQELVDVLGILIRLLNDSSGCQYWRITLSWLCYRLTSIASIMDSRPLIEPSAQGIGAPSSAFSRARSVKTTASFAPVPSARDAERA